MNNEHKLGILSVALMYVGTIMGAGFASGREIWQFFGVFGNKGYIGIFVVGALFMILGIMTSVIARKLDTNDMGKVIVPGDHPIIVEAVGYFMALMLFTVLITMSAAGGALFYQQFNQSRILGGIVITFLVIITVIGGFDRVSRVFRFMMPILLVVVISVCLMVISGNLLETSASAEVAPSPLASTWYLASVLYISYNILAVIPIVATASINSKSSRYAILGSGLGGIFLALLALVLILALHTDMNFSQAMDMPMLGYSSRISKAINIIYTCVLLFAIYASATSNFYGFTTKIKESPKKKLKIIIYAWLGFGFGLVGFTNIVAYMFPIEGFMGIGIIVMIVINFFKVTKDGKTKNNM